MKNVHTISRAILIFLVFISVNSKCYTQEQSISERVNIRIKALDKELNLSDEQEKQIQKIYTDSMERMAERFGDRPAPSGRRFGMFGGGFGRFGRIDSDVEAVLTPEQVKKYRAFNLKQQLERRMAVLDTTLTLNEDQEAKIRKIVEQDIIITNKIIAEMRDDPDADRQAIFGKIGDQREETNKAIEALLTPEQAEKYRSSMTRRRRRR